jgi:hypothetical protein
MNRKPVPRSKFVVLKPVVNDLADQIDTVKVYTVRTTSMMAAKRTVLRHFGRPAIFTVLKEKDLLAILNDPNSQLTSKTQKLS